MERLRIRSMNVKLVKDENGINCLTDRLSRDIRNSLAHAFVKAIDSGDLTDSKKIAATWLAKAPQHIYTQYIQTRLQSYEKAMEIIKDRQEDRAFYQALVLWDLGLFFEVHEILEAVWLTAVGSEKQILQAMIRAAGVYIHLGNGNRRGAEKMAAKAYATLTELRDEIPPFPGLDLLLARLAGLDLEPPKIYLYGSI